MRAEVPAAPPGAPPAGAPLSSGWQLEILSTANDLLAIQEDWRRLHAASSGGPFLTFPWFHGAWRHREAGGRLRVCVLRDELGVAALVPLCQGQWRVGLLRRPSLQFALAGWATTNDALVRPGATGWGRMLLAHLRAQEAWDICRLSKLRPSAPLLQELQSAVGDIGSLSLKLESRPSAVIRLPSTWDGYVGALGKRLRRNLRYHHNVLSRQGAVELRRVGPGDRPSDRQLDELMRDALRVHEHTWQAREVRGRAIGDPDVVGFFREVSIRLASGGLLDLSVLYAGQEPLSFTWGPATGDRVAIAKMGFDHRAQAASPGTVHLGAYLQDSIQRGLVEVDLGHEGIESKLRWTTSETHRVDLSLYSKSLIPRTVRWLGKQRRRVQRLTVRIRNLLATSALIVDSGAALVTGV